jgi:transposase-like protein
MSESKKCCKCKIVKPIYSFGKLQASKDGHRYDCKDCRKNYREENKEVINLKLKEYYEKNKDTHLEKSKIYNLENKEKINLQRKEYRSRKEIKEHIKEKNKEYLPIKKMKIKEKRIKDKNFQISEILRSKIHKILKNQKTSYINTLGCDLEFFKKWIEFRFDENMNWNNLGSYWQIDHILPINSFDFKVKENINICFHWTNLQPLQANVNKVKSDKLELHYYFNNIVNIYRFNKKNNQFLGYQTVRETLQWLRLKLRYGKNPPYENVLKETFEIDNPQPSI